MVEDAVSQTTGIVCLCSRVVIVRLVVPMGLLANGCCLHPVNITVGQLFLQLALPAADIDAQMCLV